MRWNDVGGGGAVIKLSPILPPGFKFIIDKEKEKKNDNPSDSSWLLERLRMGRKVSLSPD